ncbi:hypothetical protein B6V73_19980 [Thioclava sp. JM3]|uniref:endonuclease/exonuclease/phosphatase family protein n=1 Tax=Thioclava sp. JM3 TaxID=1973004 RepID=UPI000B53B37F|nr:endonuclease/exonuclease/phosphatase family protein [Thioclava sp. JM3]OWY08865.1 hypothetical protein B6V73_19980 [Thioclava sp. JM3]
MKQDCLRIASCNIRKAVGTDRKRDPDRILRIINELSADVVALQEADRRIPPRRPALDRRALRERTGLVPVEFEHGRDSLGWHGNAILVRPNIEVLDRAHFDLPGLEPRGAVSAVLETGGSLIRVVGVHRGLLRQSRRAQLSQLSEFLKAGDDIATVIVGDFNEQSLSVGLGRLRPDFTIFDAGPTFHSRRPIFALDRIACSQHLKPGIVGVMTAGEASVGSDHLPVFAEISMATDEARSRSLPSKPQGT